MVYQTLCARLLCSKSVGMIESAFDLCEREDKRCLMKNLPALGDRVCDDEIGATHRKDCESAAVAEFVVLSPPQN